jgi:hypothetical protein
MELDGICREYRWSLLTLFRDRCAIFGDVVIGSKLWDVHLVWSLVI